MVCSALDLRYVWGFGPLRGRWDPILVLRPARDLAAPPGLCTPGGSCTPTRTRHCTRQFDVSMYSLLPPSSDGTPPDRRPGLMVLLAGWLCQVLRAHRDRDQPHLGRQDRREEDPDQVPRQGEGRSDTSLVCVAGMALSAFIPPAVAGVALGQYLLWVAHIAGACSAALAVPARQSKPPPTQCPVAVGAAVDLFSCSSPPRSRFTAR